MKKTIILLGILGIPLTFVGASQVIKSIKFYENIAQIETVRSGNLFIYKVQDGTTNCYVTNSDSSVYGPQTAISCVVGK